MSSRIHLEQVAPLAQSNAIAMVTETLEKGCKDMLTPSGTMCVHELFEQWVVKAPDAVVIIHDGQFLTFGELNRKASCLALYLRQLGVGPEVVVGICAQDSTELLVGILGILKAGGAYVPVDPQYPQARQIYLLQDSGARILLAQRQLVPDVPASVARIILLDDEWGESQIPVSVAVNVFPSGTRPESPACIIYTSGSTGYPKGVVITHCGLVNLAYAGAHAFMLCPGDRFLQVASISFSAALEELFPALLSGASIVIAQDRHALTAITVLLDLLEQEQITAFELTTALWHELVEELIHCQAHLPASVRLVVMGGERALPALVAQWQSLGIPLVHVYGPTESTATATYYTLHAHQEFGAEQPRLPIGYPILNTYLYLLDRNLHLVHDGEAGELYIGGTALARGYWQRPDQTAEKFVPDPFSSQVGTRLYRTGDLARRLPDGSFEFLGRVDHQVKVRGFRIEPAEIEMALESHEAVGHALVMTREEKPGETQLLAYVVLAEPRPQELIIHDLRGYLRHILPDYMVPTAFVVLDAFPLTPHGKVDRAALPLPDHNHLRRLHTYSAPRTEMEGMIASVWAEVLDLEQVSIDDDFFELGGHSLLAARISSRLRTLFGVAVLPNHVLEASSVAMLARLIEQRREENLFSDASTDDFGPANLARLVQRRSLIAQAISRKVGVPVTGLASAPQQGMWFLEQLMPDSPVYSVPFSCPLVGPLTVEALQQGLQQVIERHALLRSHYLAVEGRPVQVVDLQWRVALPLIDLEGVPQDQQMVLAQQLAQQEARRPFCLHTGPLLRVCLLRLHAQHHLLLLNIHHLVFDGWSLGVLLRDWQRGYEAALSGEQEPQASLPVSYADYALWQREQRERNREGLAYWRERLAGAAAALALPTDRPRAAVPSAQGAVLSAPLLGEPWREKLEAVAREERATKFMVLLAVWVVQLWRASGQSEVVVGTPLAGRSRREVEGLIGLLVNTLPLRVRVGGQQRFRDVLKEVKEVALGAYGHQEVPLDQVVEELGVGRSVSAHPLFQVVFVAEEEEAGEQERRWAGGLQVGPMQEEETGTTKFDLTWSVKGVGSKKGGLGVNVEYSTQMFERERIEGMIEQYRRLLEAALLAPDTLLCDLPMYAEPIASKENAAFQAKDQHSEQATDDLAGVSAEEVGMVERILCDLWAEAFEVEHVGRDEDFFEIGGYSLLAMQLVASISDQFKVEITLQQFFEAITIAELAKEIVKAIQGGDEHKRVEISRVERDEKSLSELLAEIEKLSESEVHAALLDPAMAALFQSEEQALFPASSDLSV